MVESERFCARPLSRSSDSPDGREFLVGWAALRASCDLRKSHLLACLLGKAWEQAGPGPLSRPPSSGRSKAVRPCSRILLRRSKASRWYAAFADLIARNWDIWGSFWEPHGTCSVGRKALLQAGCCCLKISPIAPRASPVGLGLRARAQKRFHIVAWNQPTPRDLDGGKLSFAHQFVERAASDAVSGCGIIDAKRAALDWSDGG